MNLIWWYMWHTAAHVYRKESDKKSGKRIYWQTMQSSHGSGVHVGHVNTGWWQKGKKDNEQ